MTLGHVGAILCRQCKNKQRVLKSLHQGSSEKKLYSNPSEKNVNFFKFPDLNKLKMAATGFHIPPNDISSRYMDTFFKTPFEETLVKCLSNFFSTLINFISSDFFQVQQVFFWHSFALFRESKWKRNQRFSITFSPPPPKKKIIFINM